MGSDTDVKAEIVAAMARLQSLARRNEAAVTSREKVQGKTSSTWDIIRQRRNSLQKTQPEVIANLENELQSSKKKNDHNKEETQREVIANLENALQSSKKKKDHDKEECDIEPERRHIEDIESFLQVKHKEDDNLIERSQSVPLTDMGAGAFPRSASSLQLHSRPSTGMTSTSSRAATSMGFSHSIPRRESRNIAPDDPNFNHHKMSERWYIIRNMHVNIQREREEKEAEDERKAVIRQNRKTMVDALRARSATPSDGPGLKDEVAQEEEEEEDEQEEDEETIKDRESLQLAQNLEAALDRVMWRLKDDHEEEIGFLKTSLEMVFGSEIHGREDPFSEAKKCADSPASVRSEDSKSGSDPQQQSGDDEIEQICDDIITTVL